MLILECYNSQWRHKIPGSFVKRIIKAIARELIRPRPRGLFSFRFFLWGQSPEIKLHRQILFQARGRWPIVVWIVLQAWLALLWHLIISRKRIDKVLSFYGPDVAVAQGISVDTQRATLRKLSQAFCIDPIEAYWYDLLRSTKKATSYVFMEEVKPLHRMMNKSALPRDLDEMQDKALFTARLSEAGLPVVRMLDVVKKGAAFNPDIFAQTGCSQIFCKSRTGSRGEGAFALSNKGGQISGETLTGQKLVTEGDVAKAWVSLAAGDEFLVQPLLKAHHSFDPVANTKRPVSMRLITLQGPVEPRVLAAYLRIPISIRLADGQSHTEEVPFHIDNESGEISRSAHSIFGLRIKNAEIEDQILNKLDDKMKVPHWHQIVEASIAAQSIYCSLWALAWDWVITDEGPLLLEGNVSWSMYRPQAFNGGMISLAGQ